MHRRLVGYQLGMGEAMTPFEQFFIVFYGLTCVAFYLWEKKVKKKLRKRYRKKLRKKWAKSRKWKREMGVDGE